MSILSTWIDSFPMPLRGMANSVEAAVVSSLVEQDGYDVCQCDDTCDFIETAFIGTSDTTWWKNDKKSFIRARLFSTDSITFTILKDGVQKAVLNNDTYGEYYNFGSPVLINTDYKGIIVDWRLVKIAFGYGTYQIKTVHESLGTEYEFLSHKFDVVEYNSYRADNTVRLEVYQNGRIESGFDYTGIMWPQYLRIDGKFGNKTPTLEIDNYEDTKRNVKQIQSKTVNTYTLTTHLLPDYIFDYLNEDAIHANEIYITDYNIQNQKLYRRIPVYVSSIQDVKSHNFSKKSNFVYELKDKKNNIIKRNIDGDFGILRPEQSSTKFVEDTAIILKFNFAVDSLEVVSNEITSEEEGTYTSITDDGSSGTITIDVDGGGFAPFSSPLNLVDGNIITVKRTISTAEGSVKITGTHA